MIATGTYQSSRSMKLLGSLFGPTYPAVIAPELAYVDIIAVKVEGYSFTITNQGSPVNTTAVYFAPLGLILFPIGFGTRSVFVIYQK